MALAIVAAKNTDVAIAKAKAAQKKAKRFITVADAYNIDTLSNQVKEERAKEKNKHASILRLLKLIQMMSGYKLKPDTNSKAFFESVFINFVKKYRGEPNLEIESGTPENIESLLQKIKNALNFIPSLSRDIKKEFLKYVRDFLNSLNKQKLPVNQLTVKNTLSKSTPVKIPEPILNPFDDSDPPAVVAKSPVEPVEVIQDEENPLVKQPSEKVEFGETSNPLVVQPSEVEAVIPDEAKKKAKANAEAVNSEIENAKNLQNEQKWAEGEAVAKKALELAEEAKTYAEEHLEKNNTDTEWLTLSVAANTLRNEADSLYNLIRRTNMLTSSSGGGGGKKPSKKNTSVVNDDGIKKSLLATFYNNWLSNNSKQIAGDIFPSIKKKKQRELKENPYCIFVVDPTKKCLIYWIDKRKSKSS
jgi:hypothetical protein